MNTDTMIGHRLSLLVPKLCLGTHCSKLCFTEGSDHRSFPLAPSFAYNTGMKRTNGRVLERLLDPVSASLNDEAARKLIGIKADAQARAQVDKLARKCNEGELTPAERADYEMYVLAGDVIAILQAKARLRLSRRGQTA